MYDIIVIGGGPAGLCAALYALRAGKSVLIIEKGAFGGQITYSPKVENYPGFEQASGNEIADKFVEQVLSHGADVELEEVLSVCDNGKAKTVITADNRYECGAVIIATGAKHRKLGLEKEEEFIGDGISFCAVCDGAFYKDKTVAVIGGGNSALQEAVLLAKTSKKVIIVQNLDFLTGETKLAESLEASDNVEIIYGSVVTGYLGDSELNGIRIKNQASEEEKDIAVDGVFIAIGLAPDCGRFENLLELDKYGYVRSDERCITGSRGIYVAGDCRTKEVRQVTTATSDGAVAALAACKYIDELN